MLLHRNQALFKVDKHQQAVQSTVARNLSASVLDYMTVDDFINNALTSSQESPQAIIPILSVLAGQLKGLRTLFSLHSFFISNESMTNVLDRVQETALLILNCEDVIFVQLDDAKDEYVITHSQDPQLIGVTVANKSEVADASSRGTNSLNQFRSCLVAVLDSKSSSGAGASSTPWRPSSIIIAPMHCNDGGHNNHNTNNNYNNNNNSNNNSSVRGYVVARNKCNAGGSSSSKGVDEIVTTPPTWSTPPLEALAFSDTDSTLLGFVAVTCGIALRHMLTSASASTSSAMSSLSSVSPSRSLSRNIPVSSAADPNNNNNNNINMSMDSMILARSCTTIAKAASLLDIHNEVRTLLRTLFSCDCVLLFQVRSGVNSRSLHLVPFNTSTSSVTEHVQEDGGITISPLSEVATCIRACASKYVPHPLTECEEVEDRQLWASLPGLSADVLAQQGLLLCPIYLESSGSSGDNTNGGAIGASGTGVFCVLLVASVRQQQQQLRGEEDTDVSPSARSMNNNYNPGAITTARSVSDGSTTVVGTISNTQQASTSTTSTVSALTTNTISATPSNNSHRSLSGARTSGQGVPTAPVTIGTAAVFSVVEGLRSVVGVVAPSIASSVSHLYASEAQQRVLSVLEAQFNIVNNALFALQDYVLLLNADGVVVGANASMEAFLKEHQQPQAIRAKSAKLSSVNPLKSPSPTAAGGGGTGAGAAGVERNNSGVTSNNVDINTITKLPSPRTPGGTSPRYFLDSDERLSSIVGFHYTEFIHDTFCSQLHNDVAQSLRNGSSHSAQAAGINTLNRVASEYVDYSVFAIDKQGLVTQAEMTLSVGKDTLVFSWDATMDEDVDEGGVVGGGVGGGGDSSDAASSCPVSPVVRINSNCVDIPGLSLQKKDQQQQQGAHDDDDYNDPQRKHRGSMAVNVNINTGRMAPVGAQQHPPSSNTTELEAVVIIIKPVRNTNAFLETIRKYSKGSVLDADHAGVHVDGNANIDSASSILQVAASLLESADAVFPLTPELHAELDKLCSSLTRLTRNVLQREEMERSPNYSSLYSCRDLHSVALPRGDEPAVHNSLLLTNRKIGGVTSDLNNGAINSSRGGSLLTTTITDQLLVSANFTPPENLFTWDFNALVYHDDKTTLCCCMGSLFQELVNLPALGVDVAALSSYISVISRNYHDNPFHNFSHATTVCHVAYMLMQSINARNFLSPLKLFCVMLSCMVHDVDHPGNTNAFEVNCGSDLAIRYNDVSVLENHHCSTAFRLMKRPGLDVTKNFKSAVAADIRKTVISCVLATDMAQHFAFMEDLKKLSTVAQEVPNRSLLFSEPPNIMLLCKTLVHAADLSNPVRRFPVTRKWAELIATEFNAQVAKEEELGLPILGFMVSKDLKMICKNEMGFSTFVVAPMWRCLGQVLPELQFLVTQLDNNQAQWKAMIEEFELREEETTEAESQDGMSSKGAAVSDNDDKALGQRAQQVLSEDGDNDSGAVAGVENASNHSSHKQGGNSGHTQGNWASKGQNHSTAQHGSKSNSSHNNSNSGRAAAVAGNSDSAAGGGGGGSGAIVVSARTIRSEQQPQQQQQSSARASANE